ncbi:DUF4402 domain-containing protein [Phenylobacterium sp.]|uniref:DUF4402 domain-containing protein n=1 Tax=Phenylobacterium sp. TaxID=1871053 RepID=UPI00391DB732
MLKPRIAIIVAGLLLATGPAAAQSNSSTVVAATGVIFQPIVLTKDTDLNFGTVVRPQSGSGSVAIDAATGQRTLSGQGAVLNTGPAAGRATFTVGGEGGQTFTISAPATLTLTRSGGSETVVATLTPSATTGVLSGSLGGGPGSSSFGVGGQLPIADSLTAGAYAGTFTVTVAYN